MSELITMLTQKPGIISTGSVSDELIKKAEDTLSLKFAADYKEYLANLGCVSLPGHELTGIFKSVRLNVIDATMRNRQLFTNIPADCYVIEEANIDDIVIWQNGSGIIFKATPRTEPVQIAKSLVDYLKEIS